MRSNSVKRKLFLLLNERRPLGTTEIYAEWALRYPKAKPPDSGYINQCMHQLVQAGKAVRVKHGHYALPGYYRARPKLRTRPISPAPAADPFAD